jgi:RHH-type rel operon transcriptional repressor/antitoxin RelB
MAVSIRLAPEIEQRLDQLVAQTGRAKSYYLRELIEDGLDDLEDFTWLMQLWSRYVKAVKNC